MISNRYRNDNKNGIPLNSTQQEAKARVEQKIKNGTYTFENVSCPICSNSDDFDTLAEKDRYGLSCTTVACKRCGLLLTNPRMTQESYNQFYDREYRPLYSGSGTSTDFFFQRQHNSGIKISNFIKEHSPIKDLSGKYVVEVGCGAGGILKAFKDLGATITGLDLGSEYLKYGREKHGLNLESGTIHSYNFEKAPDVIIYSHVFEHILDVEKEIERLKAISHEKTIFYIEVPGVYSIDTVYSSDILSYLQNAHTYNFTLKTLKNLFAKHNIGLIYGDEFVHSLFSPNDTSIEKEIENIYEEEIAYLQKTEKRFNTLSFTISQKIAILSMKIRRRLFKK